MIKPSKSLQNTPYTIILRLLLSASFLIVPLIFFTDLTTNPFLSQSILLYVLIALLYGTMSVNFLRTKQIGFTQTFFDIAFFVYVLACVVSWLSAFSASSQVLRQTMFYGLLDFGTLLLVVAVGAYIISKNIPFSGQIESKTNYILLFILWGLLWFFLPFLKTSLQADNVVAHMFDYYGVFMWGVGLFLAMRVVRQLTQENIFILAFIATFLACVYGIMQSFGLDLLWPFEMQQFSSRAFSTFGNPNFLSSVVVMLLPALAVYFLRAESKKDFAVYTLLAFTFVLYLAFSLCRSCWIAAGCAFLMMWMFGTLRSLIWQRKGRMFMLIVLAMLAVYGVTSIDGIKNPVLKRVSELSNVTPQKISLNVETDEVFTSLHQRLFMWDVSKEIFLNRPVLGSGLGSFQMAFAQNQPSVLLKYPNLRELKTVTNAPHNEILFQLAQGGIVAAGLFLFMFMVLFLEVRDFAARKKEGDKKQILQALFCGILGMLADNMLNVSLQAIVPAFIFWWMVGAEASGVGREEKTMTITANPFTKAAAMAVLVVCVAVIAWQGVILASGYRGFRGIKSTAMKNYDDAKIDLAKALKLYPGYTEAGFKLGNILLEEKQFEPALWVFEKTIAAADYYDEVHFHAAIAALGVRQPEKAVHHLVQTLKLHPYNLQAYEMLAQELHQDILFANEESLKILERGLSLFPYATGLWHLTGEIYQKREETEHARSVYKRALTIDTLDSGLLKSLGSLYKKTDEKPEIYTQAEKIQALAARVDRFSSIGPKTRAKLRRDIEHYINEYIDDTNGLILFARFLSLSSNDLKAKELLDRVLEKHPDDLGALIALSTLLYQAEDVAGAQRALEKALFYYPENPTAKQRLRALGK